MLKALELIGFKSFADRTRFEFPPGITVIVGPNGSGKSNIVDAIKWVLGEQSAKSLRGRDMSDVIFKGAGGAGRKPMNTAEATIIIDNSDGRLPVDAPEVHVTRRVYRSGEGEYLINREPCRLKDIRDLFRGTGVATDAYSLIEQGKVDRLLQASPKDRRAIFEEAAGISRFKAKKVEALRRLARLDQNLLRLSDIVEEVDGRLRTVRSQAAKARRYREYTDRLQQLRTQVGRSDWRRLTQKLEAIEAELTLLNDRVGQLSAQAEAAEAAVLEIETHLEECGERVHRGDNQLARNREQIAARQSAIHQERRRAEDSRQDVERFRRQLVAMTGRAGDVQQRLRETTLELHIAEEQQGQLQRRLERQERSLQEVERLIEAERTVAEQQRREMAQRMREANALSSQVGTLQTRAENLATNIRRSQQRLEELRPSLRDQCDQLDALLQEKQDLDRRVSELAQQLAAIQTELKSDRRVVQRRLQERIDWQGHLSGCRQRADVLEEMERRREGLSAGVQRLLQQAAESPRGVLSDVRGVVADLIQADVRIAPLVDVALGELAQQVVVRGGRLGEQLRLGLFQVEDRVGLVRCDTPAPPRDSDRARLDGLPGVIGRADRLVQCDPEFAMLVNKLLGDVWLVDSLTDALRLQQIAARGARLVTAAGELLQPDGSMLVGPLQAVAGLVSRKSELLALHEEIHALEQRIERAGQEIHRLQENIDRKEQAAESLAAQYQTERSTLHQLEAREQGLQLQIDRGRGQCHVLEQEIAESLSQQQETADQLTCCRHNLVQMEHINQETESRLAEYHQRLQRAEGQRIQQLRAVTESKVESAKAEQQVEGLRARMVQFQEDQRERSRAIEESLRQLDAARDRTDEAELVALRLAAELAELFLAKEAVAVEVGDWQRRRDQLGGNRDTLLQEIQNQRQNLRREEECRHQKELEAGQARHERSALALRLREDYGIEISELEVPLNLQDQQQRDDIDEEIQSLRRKISNIGAVNMEALDELEHLESRYESLASQHRDLTGAKDSLERIIQKTNADSRRLFSETLEAIRTNFQALYRKSFGGGKADILLEEGEDILEAGIEIIATPPGKPSFNNSLLSGGEKALTAVSLLLAIFQYRPSPFCVLDEVDAPFDEANIGRFIEVLKGFLGWTKFVIVTHSKKTMTAATTLYGVTMQESGVSKQVSVRFEDVNDDGHIRQEALERTVASGDDERAA